jgi:hypothetical protein
MMKKSKISHPVQSDTKSKIEILDATLHPPSPQQPHARSYDAHFLLHNMLRSIPISPYNVKVFGEDIS